MTDLPPLAVYVHWPYCARICPYCDFNVVRERGRTDEAQALTRAIISDLSAQAALVGPRRLTSLFFGGGTPSLMTPDQVAGILAAATDLWPASPDLEVSLEANPTDAEATRFAGFAAAGVNRLSLGLQALDDAALVFLGRNHDAAEGRRAADVAARLFPRLSLDLIYARPGQTPSSWASELADAVRLGAEHVSPYQLTIEAGTAFARARDRGRWTPPDEDLAADLYETTQTVLDGLGFTAYEVSNHARGAAARSVHNLAYWRGWDYVGAGPGGHGRLTIGGVRHAAETPRRIADYIAAAGAPPGLEPLTPRQAAEERLLMGLRSSEGVEMAELGPLDIDPDHLSGLAAAGLVTVSDGRLVATPAGRPLLDRITAELAAG